MLLPNELNCLRSSGSLVSLPSRLYSISLLTFFLPLLSSHLVCWCLLMMSEHLSLPPVKIHWSLLAEDAVRHAINDYRSKKEASMLQKAEEYTFE